MKRHEFNEAFHKDLDRINEFNAWKNKTGKTGLDAVQKFTEQVSLSTKIKWTIFFFLFPFLFVYACWIITAFSFDPRPMFLHPTFWFLTIVLWVVAIICIYTDKADS